MLKGANGSLIQLKTNLRRQRMALIERPDLLGRLHWLANARLLLLIAPAGFGKTVLLTQWVDSVCAQGVAVSWLSLDKGDAEPRQFLQGLLVSLHRAGIEFPEYETLMAQGAGTVDVNGLVCGLENGLLLEERQVYIVLDDYHLASSSDLDMLFHRWIQALPDHVHVILASRRYPDIGACQFLASGFATEISAGCLRCSDQESIELLGIDACAVDLESLCNVLEGWPIALSLAALEIRKYSGSRYSFKQLVNRGSHLSSYFARELLASLSVEQVDFLLETAIFERFDVALVDAVRGRSDSGELMDSLDSLQALIPCMEGNGDWYRYHHLFAEYLRRVLHERKPARVVHLHVLASKVLAKRGFFVEAVQHAAEAGEFDRCAQMVSEAGGWKMVLYGRGHDLACALKYIPSGQYRNYPCIAAADAYLQLRSGNLHAASTALCALPDFLNQELDWEAISGDELDIFNVKMFLHGYEDNELTLDFFTWGQEQQRKIADFDVLTRGVLDNTLAVAAMSVGKFPEAEMLATRAVRTMGEAGSVLAPAHCWLHAGLAALNMGKMQSAAMHLAHARDMVNQNSREGCHLKTIIDSVQENLQLWHWQLPEEITACSAVLQNGCEHDGWFDVFAAAFDTLFRVAWIHGDVDAMERALRIGAQIANGRGIQRFQLIVNAFTLLRLIDHEHRHEARKLALGLLDSLPLGAWQQYPHLWRPFQEVGFALFRFFLLDNAVINFSLVEDLLRCAAQMGHVPCQVRAIVARAVLRERNGQRREALADVSSAIEMAVRHDLQLPFVEQPELEVLLRILERKYRQMDTHDATGGLFVSSILDARRSIARRHNVAAIKNLSPRELDVALEIGMGRTNKEIAQSLDLTVHTVKFHLRNIFAKMGVERRAHVQSFFNAPERRCIAHATAD